MKPIIQKLSEANIFIQEGVTHQFYAKVVYLNVFNMVKWAQLPWHNHS